MTRPLLTAGAIVSLGLTLFGGRHNPHMTLQVLFAGWVTAPYLLLGLADWFFRQQPGPSRAIAIRWLGAVVGLGSAVTYTLAIIHPPATKPAAPFVATPLVSFLAIALTVAILLVMDRSRSHA